MEVLPKIESRNKLKFKQKNSKMATKLPEVDQRSRWYNFENEPTKHCNSEERLGSEGVVGIRENQKILKEMHSIARKNIQNTHKKNLLV